MLLAALHSEDLGAGGLTTTHKPTSWAYHPVYWADVNHRASMGGTACTSLTKQSGDWTVTDCPSDPNVWYISSRYPRSVITKPAQTTYILTTRTIPVVGMAGHIRIQDINRRVKPSRARTNVCPESIARCFRGGPENLNQLMAGRRGPEFRPGDRGPRGAATASPRRLTEAGSTTWRRPLRRRPCCVVAARALWY